MPYRKNILAEGEIYHIFNKSVASIPIFYSSRDYSRFIELINYYRFVNPPMSFSHLIKLSKQERNDILNKLIDQNKIHAEIICFCLMPNHFHFLLKQITADGITTFMKNLQNSYAKYFNIKNDRGGSLFRSPFKDVRIETDEQLIHVSRYIHLNPSTAYLVEPENLSTYPWSSYPDYVTENNALHSLVNTEPVLSFFKTKKSYAEFVLDRADYQRTLDEIKHLALE